MDFIEPAGIAKSLPHSGRAHAAFVACGPLAIGATVSVFP